MTALVLVAAGSGQRLGAGVPKALVEVAGDSLIGHCLTTIAAVSRLDPVVVVAPMEQMPAIAQDVGSRFGVAVVPGGPTRDASVRNGLAALPPGIRHVLVHDAARPFTPAQVYARVLAALEAGAQAVVPGLPVADTIKRVRDGQVVQTLDRDELFAVQTPQGFELPALRRAHDARTTGVTDDAMLMERAGVPVHVVAGSQSAFKITTAFDLAVARAMQESS